MNEAITISINRQVRHDYAIEKIYEAGIALEGWEVKSLRAQRVQLKDSYCVVQRGEIFWLNGHISPLPTCSKQSEANATRTRKLLLHRHEIRVLIGAVQRQRFSLVPLKLYWHHQHIKLTIALAKGLKKYDKRALEKDRDWVREQQRLYTHST